MLRVLWLAYTALVGVTTRAHQHEYGRHNSTHSHTHSHTKRSAPERPLHRPHPQPGTELRQHQHVPAIRLGVLSQQCDVGKVAAADVDVPDMRGHGRQWAALLGTLDVGVDGQQRGKDGAGHPRVKAGLVGKRLHGSILWHSHVSHIWHT